MGSASLWRELSSGELGRLDPERTVALLPVAAIEQHGPHLPLATDAVINRGVIAEAVRRINAAGDPVGAGAADFRLLVLPAIDLGHSPEHLSYPGTLSIAPQTLLALWTDVVGCVAGAGIRKLLLFNSHGGQSALVDIAAVQWRRSLGLLVARASWMSLGMPPGLFHPREVAEGIHGGEIETSLMLHLAPDLVRVDRLDNFVGLPQRLAAKGGLLGVEAPVGIGWLAEDLHPAGVVGNAKCADADRGARLLAHLGGALARLVAELAEMPAPAS